MQHISSHMAGGPEKKKDRKTERGELMRYFLQKLNITRGRDGLVPLTMGRIGKALQAIPTKDIYFLKSVCDDSQKRGDINSFSKRFWWEINPKNHTEEAIKARALKNSQSFGGGVQSNSREPRKYFKKKQSPKYDS